MEGVRGRGRGRGMGVAVIVRVTITSGRYCGRGTYEGDLALAPVTTLVPEGIVSARAIAEADRIRTAITRTLNEHDRVAISGVGWTILAERLLCRVHDEDDVVPGRICGRTLPCSEHTRP